MTPNGSQYFSASYDLTTKIVSTAVFVVFGLIFLATSNAIVAVVCLAVMVVSYAFSPRGYTISNGRIAVKRLRGNVDVPLDGVREVRRATADDFTGGIRLFGDGGLFGYYGLFRTSKLGKCTWYVTNRSNAVVLIANAKTYIFSPDDVDGFVAAIRPSLVPGVSTGRRVSGRPFQQLREPNAQVHCGRYCNCRISVQPFLHFLFARSSELYDHA